VHLAERALEARPHLVELATELLVSRVLAPGPSPVVDEPVGLQLDQSPTLAVDEPRPRRPRAEADLREELASSQVHGGWEGVQVAEFGILRAEVRPNRADVRDLEAGELLEVRPHRDLAHRGPAELRKVGGEALLHHRAAQSMRLERWGRRKRCSAH
jgi:hypothetical protein